MNVLVIQNNHIASPGYIGECIEKRKGTLHIYNPLDGDQLPTTDKGYDSLIILGGIMNAEEDQLYPHLQDVLHLIHQFHTADKPLLGVCLGAQLIARAFGKRVYPHHTSEVGFTNLLITEEGKQNQLIRSITTELNLMQWHNDTFDLPENSTLLMTGDICKNQAFRIGFKTYGFQCHFEVTDTMLKQWFDTYEELLKEIDTEIKQKLDKQIPQYIEQSNDFCELVIHRWMDLSGPTT